MSAVIIPFPTVLPAAEINGRLQGARQMSWLAGNAERRAYITGYMDGLSQKMAGEPPGAPPSRRRK